MSKGRSYPIEDFVQAFTAQLDRAQDLLALKARTGRPLTFALRDLNVDLNVFLETDAQGRLMMRHAAPNEAGSSTLHFNFTTITRSMAEENTLSLTAEEDPRGLEDLSGAQGLDEATRRRLEWAGVRTVGQLKKLSHGTDPKSVQAFLGIPVMQLQSLLEQASRPTVTGHEVLPRGDGRPLLRIRGANLADGVTPEVRLSGEPVEVLEATPSAVLVRPLSHHREGQVEVFVANTRATGFYRMPEGYNAQPLGPPPGSPGNSGNYNGGTP